MSRPERVEIRPKRFRNAGLVALCGGAFVAAGVWMIVQSRYLLPVGLVAIGFFGWSMIIALPQVMRRGTALVLTPECLELRYGQGTARIFWQQIESVGLFTLGRQKLVGLRIRQPSAWQAGLPDTLARDFAAHVPFLRASALMASSLPALPGSGTSSRWRRPLREVAEARTLPDVLAWNRRHFGFDLCLSWVDRDRPADRFAALLEEYRAAASDG